MFTNVLDYAAETLTIQTAGLCVAVALGLGIIIAFCYRLTGESSKNFLITLALLPAMVQTVIMMVNGNLGTGVAIVGAFSLIRFRSIPGTSREISAVFFTMVVGLATGMGYLSYAAFITVALAFAMLVLHLIPVNAKEERQQSLRITTYENLDYTTVFDDLFEKYLKTVDLENVKTINMGSMYQIQYVIEMKDRKEEKEFLDALRCRNGNLTIQCGRVRPQFEKL